MCLGGLLQPPRVLRSCLRDVLGLPVCGHLAPWGLGLPSPGLRSQQHVCTIHGCFHMLLTPHMRWCINCCHARKPRPRSCSPTVVCFMLLEKEEAFESDDHPCRQAELSLRRTFTIMTMNRGGHLPAPSALERAVDWHALAFAGRSTDRAL